MRLAKQTQKNQSRTKSPSMNSDQSSSLKYQVPFTFSFSLSHAHHHSSTFSLFHRGFNLQEVCACCGPRSPHRFFVFSLRCHFIFNSFLLMEGSVETRIHYFCFHSRRARTCTYFLTWRARGFIKKHAGGKKKKQPYSSRCVKRHCSPTNSSSFVFLSQFQFFCVFLEAVVLIVQFPTVWKLLT